MTTENKNTSSRLFYNSIYYYIENKFRVIRLVFNLLSNGVVGGMISSIIMRENI